MLRTKPPLMRSSTSQRDTCLLRMLSLLLRVVLLVLLLNSESLVLVSLLSLPQDLSTLLTWEMLSLDPMSGLSLEPLHSWPTASATRLVHRLSVTPTRLTTTGLPTSTRSSSIDSRADRSSPSALVTIEREGFSRMLLILLLNKGCASCLAS